MSSDYFWFEEMPFPAMGYNAEIIGKILYSFVLREDTSVKLSYPKSGTNWLIQIVCLIETKGDPKWIQSMPIWECSPWIDTGTGYSMLSNKEGPRLISSHLPIYLFHKSLFSSTNKIIYVFRDPRDVLGSGYHFGGKTNLVKNPESLETYFEWFLKENGQCPDTRATIKKICKFLGKKLEPNETDLVLKYSSFQAMKESKTCDFNIRTKDIITSGLQMFRKGKQFQNMSDHVEVFCQLEYISSDCSAFIVFS
uniref:bile salt sulfotransferase 1-like n=1 Tax=Arvicanthis niloticus TaxID=61156 RepID=UPI0014865A20|nr:bile salt sulfotransferase 1-like [Arvicanthis niloticus]